MDDLLFKSPSLETALIKRPYLESLATHELVRLADSFGIDIPPELERIFIITEIMDMASDYSMNESGLGNETPVLIETAIPEPVPLPKQYNITFIEVMIRDPLWAFTFWEIRSHDKEVFEHNPDFEGYHLKVSTVSSCKSAKEEDSFRIPVGTTDAAWYLGFPPEGGCFKVELCVVLAGEEIRLVASQPFTLPTLFNPPHGRDTEGVSQETMLVDDVYQNPLIRLTGVKDFHVLRNVDRRSRVKWEDDS
jgi:hypothetical protein